MHEPGDRSVEPDPDERDEHAYEDTWYRALKAHSEHLQNDPPPPDEDDPPEDG
jgi:hypothetical protein